MVSEGGEGIILRKLGSSYVQGRSESLFKIKVCHSTPLPISYPFFLKLVTQAVRDQEALLIRLDEKKRTCLLQLYVIFSMIAITV